MTSYYLGADASKGYSDFVMMDAGKNVTDKDFQLDDTFDGHIKLAQYLRGFVSAHPDAMVYAALESTGGYENNWFEKLLALSESLPVKVARLNPSMVKNNSEAGLRRTKTDAVSAQDIAEYLISHPEKVRYDQQWYPTLRRQWSFIRLNIKQKTQLANQLQAILYTSMPEVLTFCKNGMPRWLLLLLKEYPRYQKMKEAGYEKLMKISYVSKSRSVRLTEMAQKGIGKSDEVSAQVISGLAEQILSLGKAIESQKKMLEHNYRSCGEGSEEIEILRTFKGIGTYSAVGLLLNIGSVDLFDDVKKIASHFGVHPKWKQSGDGTWGNHMSKQGRAEGRAILFMVAKSAIQYNPVVKATYARCLARGMKKMAAIGLCMHKILRIVYGMLKHRKAFDLGIHNRNLQRTQRNPQKPKPDQRRRIQSFDPDAPVSRRQRKKREEQTAKSHGEQIAVCGIEEPAPHFKLIKTTQE